MKNTMIALMALAMTSAVARGAETNTKPKIAKGPFEPTVASLTQHQTPDWFRDAKFGIYTHWGPVAVGTARQPAGQSDTWYGRYMYIPGLSGPQYHGGIPSRTTFEDHRRNFGDQAKFGFKDIIPLFKAERFNADEWADLFEKSGAKFAGTVVIHHDNFAMWDSQVTRWNAVKMGPKRDLTGELERAIHKRGMKFVAAMHHAMTWYYYEPAFAYDAKDPQYSDLYGEPHPLADKDLSKDLNAWDAKNKAVVLDGKNCTWSRKCIGMPSVIVVGKRLAIFYDGPGGDSTDHMNRDVGLAWLELPLTPPAGSFKE